VNLFPASFDWTRGIKSLFVYEKAPPGGPTKMHNFFHPKRRLRLSYFFEREKEGARATNKLKQNIYFGVCVLTIESLVLFFLLAHAKKKREEGSLDAKDRLENNT
jgi:hypothetical protein